MGQGHDSIVIANIFVDKSHKNPSELGALTLMSLLKYVYFAHGLTLGRTDNPLICHTVEAWKYGPVVPEIYRKFSRQGIYIRQHEPAPFHRDKLSPEEENIVDDVYKIYSQMSAFRLSAITHEPGSPWDKFRHHHYGTIPNDVIREFYADKHLKQP